MDDMMKMRQQKPTSVRRMGAAAALCLSLVSAMHCVPVFAENVKETEDASVLWENIAYYNAMSDEDVLAAYRAEVGEDVPHAWYRGALFVLHFEDKDKAVQAFSEAWQEDMTDADRAVCFGFAATENAHYQKMSYGMSKRSISTGCLSKGN